MIHVALGITIATLGLIVYSICIIAFIMIIVAVILLAICYQSIRRACLFVFKLTSKTSVMLPMLLNVLKVTLVIASEYHIAIANMIKHKVR